MFARICGSRCFFHAHTCGLTKKSYGNAQPLQRAGKAQVDVGKVDQYGEILAAHAGRPL